MQTPINVSDPLQEEHTPALEDTPTPEATSVQQEEGTPPAALAPLEEEVIDGEVIAIIEPEHKPTPKQPPYYLIVVFTIVGCLLFTLVSFLLPLLTPTAIVTIIPIERTITTTAAIQVQGRQLPTLTLSQSQTTPATGKGHQEATQAQGEITFYNGLLTSQTIAAGTPLTGADGVEIITDQAATLPPASNTTPPTFGQVTVLAHAVQPGAGGNISPYDINGSCCAASILAKNTTSFTGGQNARDYTVVTGDDMINAATSLKTSLLISEQGALNAQLHSDEALIPPSCQQTTTADHKVGDEAKEITITVSETCSGIAYNAHDLHLLATQMISQQPAQTGYTVFGDVTANVIHATIAHQAHGIATLTVKLDTTYIYTFPPGETQQLRNMIAGKTKQQAIATLLRFPGIAGAHITMNGENQMLPQDPGAIRIIVLYRAIYQQDRGKSWWETRPRPTQQSASCTCPKDRSCLTEWFLPCIARLGLPPYSPAMDKAHRCVPRSFLPLSR
jgi:hypothetical protein